MRVIRLTDDGRWYLTSPRLAKVHWQVGDRLLPAPVVSVAGESALWVDPAEIPSDGDIGKVGQALAAPRPCQTL